MTRRFILIIAASLLAAGVGSARAEGNDQPGAAENKLDQAARRTGDWVDRAAKSTNATLDRAAKKTGAAVEKAADKTESALQKALRKTAEALERAGRTVQGWFSRGAS